MSPKVRRPNSSCVPPLTGKEYFARGSTALLDAVGKTIDAVGERLASTPEEQRPAKVIYMNGAAYHTGYINDAAAVYTAGADDANDTLVFEFYIALENLLGVNADTNELRLTFGGQLFADATSTTNVWQTYASNALVLREGYHAVSFDGVAENEPSLLIVAVGSAVGTLPQAAERSGYTFDGWYVNDQKIDATYEPAGNVTAVARYSPVAPVITFSSGEAFESMSSSNFSLSGMSGSSMATFRNVPQSSPTGSM